MKVYLVVQYDYDGVYFGHIYSNLQDAEAEAAVYNDAARSWKSAPCWEVEEHEVHDNLVEDE